MKKTVLFLLLVILASMAIGCQKTPKQPIVIEKNDKSMIDKAQKPQETSSESPAEQTIDAPQAYQDTFQKGKLHVNVNARIDVPVSGALPIIRVKAADFTQDQVTALFRILCGDTTMYVAPSQRTKSDLQRELVDLKKKLAEAKNEKDTGGQEYFTERIAETEKQLASAPEEIEQVVADGTLSQMEEINSDTGDVVGHYTGLLASSETKSFDVSNNSDRKETITHVRKNGGGGMLLRTDASMRYLDYSHTFSYIGGNEISIDTTTTAKDMPALSHFKTTPSQAKELVSSLIKTAGIPMVVRKLWLISDAQSGDGGSAEAKNYAYKLDCARVVGEIPCAIVAGSATGGSKEQFAPAWFYENLTFLVNDDGILSMTWSSPYTLMETVVDRCKLLSFSQVEAVFKKMMPICYEYEANQIESGDTTIHIDSISLELVRTSEQNSINTGLLVPAWRFYGTKEQAGQKENGCWLTVNAVDGSVIDTNIGH